MTDGDDSERLCDAARLGAVTVVRIVAYIAGTSPSGHRTVEALRRMAHDIEGTLLELDVVDVLENPDRAEVDRIVATPTVIRIDPLPRVRLVGDLSAAVQHGDVAQTLFDT